MNKKELNEIRRRIRPERSSIGQIYGCYVNAAGEIIASFEESMGLLTKEEQEKYLSLLKKSLSGSLGKNLMPLSFATKQVMDSEEHRLLSALRKTELKDALLREEFYKAVIPALDLQAENYLILLAFDAYDVPHYGKDGAEDDSREVYKYILCSICPVKPGKGQLGYDAGEKRFRHAVPGQAVAAPELGFLFPSFDDRSANIYSALFYSRGSQEIHPGFIDAVFRTPVPMSAGRQREAFSELLGEFGPKELSYDVIQSVQEQLQERVTLHKESRDPEPLTLSSRDMGDILENSGLSPEQAEQFCARCAEQFGEDAQLHPENLMDGRKLSLQTPEVKIQVDPKFGYLVQTRVIDGKKYILIAADSGVEVNGIAVDIRED